MAEPVESFFVHFSEPLDATIEKVLVAGEGSSVAEARLADGRPALVVDDGTLADLMPPDERSEFGKRVLVFDSPQARSSYATVQEWVTKTSAGPETLLGHLAVSRGEVFTQAEVLCTLSLAWILNRCGEANEAFCDVLGVGGRQAWIAEDVTSGVVGRPDLVGRAVGGGPPTVIVEAKLGAPLDELQLRSFAEGGCPVVLLVPQARVDASRRKLDQVGLPVRVVSWEEALKRMDDAVGASSASAADLAQLIDLYRQVERTWIAPFTTSQLEDRSGRAKDFIKLADQVSALVHKSINRVRGTRANLLPWQRSPHRYVSMKPGEPGPTTHVAIGVFEEVEGPLGIRWHKGTAALEEVVARLEASQIALVRDSGHVFVSLRVPADSAHHEVVGALLEQLHAVIDVAEPELRPLGFTRDSARAFIAQVRWKFAKTMPQWPHEYTVRDWQPEVEQDLLSFAALIRRDGVVKPWPRDSATPRYHHAYLELDGWEYWTMEESIADTSLINRAQVEEPV